MSDEIRCKAASAVVALAHRTDATDARMGRRHEAGLNRGNFEALLEDEGFPGSARLQDVQSDEPQREPDRLTGVYVTIDREHMVSDPMDRPH